MTWVENSRHQGVRTAMTFLFVPGSRQDRYQKAVDAGADVVIIDLEDAVADDDKVVARSRLAAWLDSGGEAAVRVNGIGTPWFHKDLAAAPGASAIVLPKAESPIDIDRVTQATQGEVPIIPLIETPRGLMAATEICSAEGVARVGFGNVDFAAEVGLDPASHAALTTARSMLVYASSAAGLAPPVDGVTTNLKGREVLLRDAHHARELGFTGKLLIHPSQVDPVARTLRPTEAEIRWARGVLSSTGGVGVHSGHMVDAPVLARARRLLEGSRPRVED